jgi:ribonuclease BN (tRNA processing enzyme)
LWGTRGTVPVPAHGIGPADQRLGGNTPCVLVESGADPPVILDAGSGLYWLGNALMEQGFATRVRRAHLFLTHTHWAHVQGIPFFAPFLVPGCHLTFYGPGSGGRSLWELLNLQMESVYCPVPNAFRGDVGSWAETRDLEGGELEGGEDVCGRVRVTARRVNHVAGSVCLGYRVEADGAVLTYLPDVEYLTRADRAPALELARDADLLLHDAHFTAAEYAAHQGQGHAAETQAVELAREAGVRRLLLFHHHPGRSRGTEYSVLDPEGKCGFMVEAAREGTAFNLGSPSDAAQASR